MTAVTEPGRPRRVPAGWWWALAPLAVAPAGLLGPDTLLALAAAVGGLGVVILAAAHPGPALTALVLAAGLQRPVQGLLLQVAPAEAIRATGFTKEALLVGLVVAGWRAHRRRDLRLDRVDRAALLFCAVVAGYLAVQVLLGPVVRVFPAAPRELFTLALAARANIGMLLVLLAVRSLDLPPRWRRHLVTATLGVAALAGGAAVLEFVAQDVWQDIENTWLELPRLRVLVFDTAADARATRSVVGGRLLVRAGAWSDFLTVGFFLVPPLALALVRSSLRPAPRRLLLTGVIGAGIVATLTRSAVLAGLVTVLVTALGFPATRRNARTRLLLLAMIGLVLAGVLAGSSGLVARTTAAFTGDDASAEDHVASTTAGIERALDHPLGLGLGVQPSARRGGEGGEVVTENAYLQVANELGILPAIVLAVLLWRLTRALYRRGDPVARGLSGAVAGLALAGLFLHVWLPIDGPWVLMALAGAWLPRSSRPDPGEPVEQVRQR